MLYRCPVTVSSTQLGNALPRGVAQIQLQNSPANETISPVDATRQTNFHQAQASAFVNHAAYACPSASLLPACETRCTRVTRRPSAACLPGRIDFVERHVCYTIADSSARSGSPKESSSPRRTCRNRDDFRVEMEIVFIKNFKIARL